MNLTITTIRPGDDHQIGTRYNREGRTYHTCTRCGIERGVSGGRIPNPLCVNCCDVTMPSRAQTIRDLAADGRTTAEIADLLDVTVRVVQSALGRH